MRGQKKFAKRTRSRGAWDTQRGQAVIRDRVIGQHRSQRKNSHASPDMQDRFHNEEAVPLIRTLRARPGMGVQAACAGCGRTKDLWEENNGMGLSKAGRRYCCKPCSEGKRCRCVDMDARKGMELSGALPGQNLGPATRDARGHNKHR
jgi:hypothetical protein